MKGQRTVDARAECPSPGDCNCYDRERHVVGYHQTDCEFAGYVDDHGRCDYRGCLERVADYKGARYVCASHIAWSQAHRGGGPAGTVYPLDDWRHLPDKAGPIVGIS